MKGIDPILGVKDPMELIESVKSGNRKQNREKVQKNRKKNDGEYKESCSWKECGVV